VQNFPTHIKPPIFPLRPPPDYKARPTNLKHINKTIKPVLDDTAAGLANLIGSVAGDETSRTVMKSLRIWKMRQGADVEENPYALHLLDDFGELGLAPCFPWLILSRRTSILAYDTLEQTLCVNSVAD
jgi:hypothetical protein